MQRAPGTLEESSSAYLAAPEVMERSPCWRYRRPAVRGRRGQDGEDLGGRRKANRKKRGEGCARPVVRRGTSRR